MKPTDYIPTQKDIELFKQQNYKGSVYKPVEKRKSSNGTLILKQGDRVTTVKYDAPFALLQHIKQDMIRQGYRKEELIITYK